MTDIVVRLRKIAEDLSAAEGYSGYVRTMIEACAEIEQLRRATKSLMGTLRVNKKSKGKPR